MQHSYFDQQSEKILQAFQKLELLKFLLLIGVLLMLSYFLKPLLNQALRLMMQSVFVHAVVEKFLGNQFGQSISSQRNHFSYYTY